MGALYRTDALWVRSESTADLISLIVYFQKMRAEARRREGISVVMYSHPFKHTDDSAHLCLTRLEEVEIFPSIMVYDVTPEWNVHLSSCSKELERLVHLGCVPLTVLCVGSIVVKKQAPNCYIMCPV